MASLLQTLLLILAGLVLLWFGLSLFLRLDRRRSAGAGGKLLGGGHGGHGSRYPHKGGGMREGAPGAPRTCPVCAASLEYGERVKSSAFPEVTGQGRLMHIEGCIYCLGGERQEKRRCPVCGALLNLDEILIARMFDKPGRSHVHVLGCSRCRGPGSGRNEAVPIKRQP
jgi:predicted nucleic acid-binding Zn ribbon protein